MDQYKALINPTYFFTTEASEIAQETLDSMNTEDAFDFDSEPLLAACWKDFGLFGAKGKSHFWVIVTEKRVVALQADRLRQSAFGDLTGVDRGLLGGVLLISLDKKFDVFSPVQLPKKELADRMYGVIRSQWETVSSATTQETPKESSESNDTLEQLERLAKLHQDGLLSSEEFEVQKAKVLAG